MTAERISKVISRYADADVDILADTEVRRFEGKQAYVVNEGRELLPGEFDSVVVAVGTCSVNDLEPLLRATGIEVRVIGDAKKPRQIYDAVHEGYDVAVSI